MSSIAPTVIFNVPTDASNKALQMVAEVILPPTEELGEYFSYAVAEQKVRTCGLVKSLSYRYWPLQKVVWPTSLSWPSLL